MHAIGKTDETGGSYCFKSFGAWLCLYPDHFLCCVCVHHVCVFLGAVREAESIVLKHTPGSMSPCYTTRISEPDPDRWHHTLPRQPLV